MRSREEIEAELSDLAEGNSNDAEIDGLGRVVEELLNDREVLQKELAKQDVLIDNLRGEHEEHRTQFE